MASVEFVPTTTKDMSEDGPGPQETAEAQPEQPASEEQQQEEATPKTVEETPAGEDVEEPEDDVPIVLVTGASGYIGMYIVKQLLEQGHYRVRGTVRDKNRNDKVKPLQDLVPDAKYPLRLVNADLENPDSWAKAVKRCSYVFHVAWPVSVEQPNSNDDDYEVIRPAVESTINVLKMCAEAGTVKCVVFTSSTGAISGMGEHCDEFRNEKCWPVEELCSLYEKSKLKAERAAWRFVLELDRDKKFDLVVMNPGYVVGPFLSKESGECSAALLTQVLTGSSPVNVSFGIVDVRDVAAAHIAGMLERDARGKRHILVSDTVTLVEVSEVIAAEFRPQGYKISVRPVPKIGLFFGRFFNAKAKLAYSLHGKHVLWWNGRMKHVLRVEPRPVEETLWDACYSLIDMGLVKKTPGYLGHPSTRPKPEPEPTV